MLYLNSAKIRINYYFCHEFQERDEMKKLLIAFLLLIGFSTEFALSQKIVRVGVMLPFKNQEGNISPRAIDFYRGIVMAADSLRKDGTSFRIYTYNTANTSINTILNDTIIPHLDIIYGPDDKMMLKVISDFTSSRGTKVIDAFEPTCDAVQSNPNFYVVFSPEDIVANDAANLFDVHFADTKKNVIIVDTKKVAHPFIAVIKNVSKKVRFLQAGFTQNQLGSRLSKNKTNFLVLSSADKESAVDILEQIVLYKKNYPQYDIRLIGYPEWLEYSTFLADKMYFLDTYVYTSYYNNQLAQRNKNFQQTYKQLFKEDMDATRPVMALFGFDCAYFMLKALARYGRNYVGQDVYAAPLQNALQFKTFGNSGGMMNHFVQFVHYKPENQIELIKLK